MPSRKQILVPVLVVLIAIVIALSAARASLHTSPHPLPPAQSTSTALQAAPGASSSTPEAPVQSPQPAAAPAPKTAQPVAATPRNTPTAAVSAMLVVNGSHYSLSLPADSTVQSAMRQLAASDPSFTFTEKEYPGMGSFITSINGVANTADHYWFLYVNGTQTQTGMSMTPVHQGDVIEWKYQQ